MRVATGAIQAGVASGSGERAAGDVWLRRYAWFVVVYSVLVVLWGVVVRATGSGAGCGDHWPLCNGQVIPIHPQLATVIEYTHRMMSGPSEVPLIIVLLVWVFRATAKGHVARSFAVAGLVLTFTEGLLGALLVKLGLTATSTSPLRPPMLALHLSNTLVLLGSLALTAHFVGRRTAMIRGAVRFEHRVPAIVGLLAAMVIGITGSLAALGDTLFPATSLKAAFAADFSASSEWLIRLRILHPASAVVAGAFILWLLWRAVFAARDDAHRSLGLWLAGLLGFQFLLGGLDVLLRAPVWMQVLHLAGADAFWCVLVVLTAAVTITRVPVARAS
ncbi:MAG TPA: COX15/CtaA family protein [Acidobacteriaceae bacterium]